MTKEEIDRLVTERGKDRWPVGMALCFAAALLFYASLGHDFQTLWEKLGFGSMAAAGIVNGAIWARRESKLDRELRKRLEAEVPR